MMQFIDRSKITEEPITPRVLVHRKPRIAPVICAETIQAEQRGERFSLRRMK